MATRASAVLLAMRNAIQSIAAFYSIDYTEILFCIKE